MRQYTYNKVNKNIHSIHSLYTYTYILPINNYTITTHHTHTQKEETYENVFIIYLPKRIFTILQYHKTSYNIPINYKNPKWKNRKNDISQQLHRFISNKLHHFTQKSLTQQKNVIISMIYNKNIVFRHIVTAQNTNAITSKYGLLFS